MMSVLQGKTLLIVEDEPSLREPLVEEFRSLGCRALEAPNGRRAFEIIQSEKVDGVVSDIRMPGGDGIELLKNIKEYNYRMPTVMLITGFSDLSREDAYDLGAEAILSKPFDLDEIGHAVARMLTPPDQRWEKAADPKKVKLTLEQEFQEVQQAVEQGQLRLGRGGMFVQLPGLYHATGDLVALKIRFKTGEALSFEGAGIVRWVRHDGQAGLGKGCGVEFESLNADARGVVLRYSELFKTKSYIPKV